MGKKQSQRNPDNFKECAIRSGQGLCGQRDVFHRMPSRGPQKRTINEHNMIFPGVTFRFRLWNDRRTRTSSQMHTHVERLSNQCDVNPPRVLLRVCNDATAQRSQPEIDIESKKIDCKYRNRDISWSMFRCRVKRIVVVFHG